MNIVQINKHNYGITFPDPTLVLFNDEVFYRDLEFFKEGEQKEVYVFCFTNVKDIDSNEGIENPFVITVCVKPYPQLLPHSLMAQFFLKWLKDNATHLAIKEEVNHPDLTIYEPNLMGIVELKNETEAFFHKQ